MNGAMKKVLSQNNESSSQNMENYLNSNINKASEQDAKVLCPLIERCKITDADNHLVFKPEFVKSEPEDDYEVGRPPKWPRREIDNTNWSQFNITVPDDVVRFEDVVPIAVNKLKIGDRFYGELGEIFDLSKFWICDSRVIRKFTSYLMNFYDPSPPNYNIPSELVREELYCVTFYHECYVRCVILNVLDDLPGLVQVFLIDVGTVKCVGIKDLYYLHNRFAKVPALAMRARLANVVPLRRNDVWSLNAVSRFLTVTGTILTVEVVAVDKDMILDVLLTKVLTDLCINNLLIDEGYALKKYEEQTDSKLYDQDCIPLVDNIHLYPTFDKLESGNFLTTRCYKPIYDLMLPAHWYMPSYFKITLPWTDSIFDDVQRKNEKNKKKQQCRNDTKISIIEEDICDLSLINLTDIRLLLN